MERCRYDAYGACTVLDADGSDDADGLSDAENPYAFTARRLDLESDLMYYRNRQYSVTLGRFICRDPQGYTEFLNLYSYVGGRPMWGADPLGNTPCSWFPEVSGPEPSVEYYYGAPTLLRAEYAQFSEVHLTRPCPSPDSIGQCVGEFIKWRCWRIDKIQCWWVRAVIRTVSVKGTVTIDFRNVCWRPYIWFDTMSFYVDWEHSDGDTEGPEWTMYTHNDPDNPIIVWAKLKEPTWYKVVSEEHKAFCKPPRGW